MSVGSPVHRIVLDLLHGVPLSDEIIRESLKSTPSLSNKLFRLFYVDVKADVDRQLAAYYALLLKQQFSDMSLICVEFKEQLVVLIYGEDEQDHDAQITQLCQFFSAHSLRCGISNPFHRLSTLQGHFQQAIAALERAGAEGVQTYQNVMLEHMLSFIPADQIPFLVSPDIARIQKAEGDFSFSLLKTLQVYLDCGCNLNQAAERLFIHKNTLLYRMNHIRSIIHCDLNDPNERFLLMLSFKLLER
jgi:DNA-binding PucR family transcriptional regulator